MSQDNYLQLWTDIRGVFDETFKKYDRIWQTRSREIDSRFLTLFLFRLIIPKDNRGYSCTLVEIFANFLNYGLDSHKKKLAKSSICEARQKLDPQMFIELNKKIIDKWEQYIETPLLWRGHRLRAIDGSKFTLPKSLLEVGYKTEGGGTRYYPTGLVSAMYDLLSGMPLDFDLASHNNERTCALKHMQSLQKNDVVVHDRGYFSFELLASYTEIEVYPVFRVKSKAGYEVIDQFWDSNETDKIVQLKPPYDVLMNAKKGLYKKSIKPINVRLIKYEIKGTTYVLCTTLLDKEKYPPEIFPDLYHSRWGVEEMIKVSKLITGVEDFHSKNDTGVKQELFAHFLMITLQKIIEAKSHSELMKDKTEKVEKPHLKRIMKHKNKRDVENSQMTNSRAKLEDRKSLEPKNVEYPKVNQEDLTKKTKEDKIKINQKNAFIVFGGVIEKLLFSSLDILKDAVTYMVGAVGAVYEKIRPGRSYPRESKKPGSRWSHEGRDKKWKARQSAGA